MPAFRERESGGEEEIVRVREIESEKVRNPQRSVKIDSWPLCN
jgi:hypothetical protein